MAWVKFSDDTPRATADLTDAEFRLWFDLHCHAMTQLSDGRLAKRDVAWVLDERPAGLFNRLVDAGRVEQAAAGWQIVDYERSQSTAAEIAHGQRKAAERQARQRKHRIGDHSDCQARYCSAIRDGWLQSRRDATGVTQRRDTTFPEPNQPETTLGVEGGSGATTASAGATASVAPWEPADLPYPDLPAEDNEPCPIGDDWELSTYEGKVCVFGPDDELRALGESYAARGGIVEYGDGVTIGAPNQLALWREIQAKLLGLIA